MRLAFAEAAAPTAGGAALTDILIALALSSVYFTIVGVLLVRERLMGKRTLVGRAFDAVGEKIGLPGWAAVPALVLIPLYLTAGFGVYWDVPLHMQKGRDDGAFANPSHYPIFLVLMGMFAFSLVIMAMAKDPLPRHTLKLAPSWRVPYSSVVLFAAGFIGVLGFPLDDVWHRIFGQDVTEWGPTHVLMIGGAVTSPWALPLLLAESQQVGARLMQTKIGHVFMTVAISLTFLPLAFLMEFDLGVPQFPAATQGMIMSFSLAIAVIGARLWFGVGGALIAGAIWYGAHWFLVAVIAPLPGVLTIDFLTSIPFVVIVELVALAFAIGKHPHRLVPFAVVAAALGGSLGYWIELGWSGSLMPPPAPFGGEATPYLLVTSTAAGVAGALLSLWTVRRLQDVGGEPVTSAQPLTPQTFRWFGLAGFLAFVAMFSVVAPPMQGQAREVEVTYSDVSTGDEGCTEYAVQCLATTTVRFTGEDPVPDATWFYALAWQGDPREPVEPRDEIPTDPASDAPGIIRTTMVATGNPGEYRSSVPLPLYGQWKTLIRLHEGTNDMMSWPLYMPDDPAITSDRGREVRTLDGDTIANVYEPHLLQRERKDSIPESLYALGNYAVMSLWVIVLLGFGACYNRAAAPARASRDQAVASV